MFSLKKAICIKMEYSNAFIIFVIFVIGINFNAEACIYETATNDWEYIASHNSYPLSYSNHFERCWTITTSSANHIIRLKTVDFDVEPGFVACEFDFLRITDSNNANNGQSVDKCGFDSFEIYSSGRNFHLNFTTDYSVRYSGFELKFKQVDPSEYDADTWTTTQHTYALTDHPIIEPYPTASSGDEITFWHIVGIIFGILLAIIIMIVICCVGCVICITKQNKQGRVIDPNGRVSYIGAGNGMPGAAVYNPSYNPGYMPPVYSNCGQPPLYSDPGVPVMAGGAQATVGHGLSAQAPGAPPPTYAPGVTDANGAPVAGQQYSDHKPPIPS